MSPRKRRAKTVRKKSHSILILLLIAAGIFLFTGEFGREDVPDSFFDRLKPEKKPLIDRPWTLPQTALPKIAIVIDDLGPSRELAEQVMDLNGPVTLSILPQQRYSLWIAQEGARRGRDMIVHLPMEASRPLKLGEGGLYIRMEDKEIMETVRDNILSVPNITGASNHMGSAFTEDRRAMGAAIAEIRKHGLFFLDSLTTPESVAYDLAKSQGLKTYRRDVFLDDADNPEEIKIQWNRLLRIAKNRGHAIALGHPKKNTLDLLQKALRDTTQFTLVPISALLPSK
jgi:polysaccharide deacetylase 2 family uncharacterized protein YibQ